MKAQPLKCKGTCAAVAAFLRELPKQTAAVSLSPCLASLPVVGAATQTSL